MGNKGPLEQALTRTLIQPCNNLNILIECNLQMILVEIGNDVVKFKNRFTDFIRLHLAVLLVYNKVQFFNDFQALTSFSFIS